MAKTSLPILTATLNAAAHDAALQRMIDDLAKRQAELTLLAVGGFNPARAGNAAHDARALAVEVRDTAAAMVAALDVVINACGAEAPPEPPAPNVVPMIRAVPVIGSVR
jgi:hypothetical protein